MEDLLLADMAEGVLRAKTSRVSSDSNAAPAALTAPGASAAPAQHVDTAQVVDTAVTIREKPDGGSSDNTGRRNSLV